MASDYVYLHGEDIAILIIIEGQLQVFQQFSSSKLVLKTVESCYTPLNYYKNGSSVSRDGSAPHAESAVMLLSECACNVDVNVPFMNV